MISPMMMGGYHGRPVGGFMNVTHAVHSNTCVRNANSPTLENSTNISYNNNVLHAFAGDPSGISSSGATNITNIVPLVTATLPLYSPSRESTYNQMASSMPMPEMFIVPSSATTITINMWGGGGGAGGYWSGGSVAPGGGGGYVRLVLTVGTHIQAGEVLYCAAGHAGGGGQGTWYGGVGGQSSVVWKGSLQTTKATMYGLIDTASKRTNALIAVAGGGGGGGGRNWSSGSAAAGGSGNSAHAGSAGFFSGTNAGGTSTRHGLERGTPTTTRAMPANAGWIAGSGKASLISESSFTSLFASSVSSFIAPGASHSGGVFVMSTGGGCGAFRGSGGGFLINNESSNILGAGGGGGSSKVYIGTQQAMSANGVTHSTTNQGTGNAGYGVGGSTWWRPSAETNSNYFWGRHGTPGRITVVFN